MVPKVAWQVCAKKPSWGKHWTWEIVISFKMWWWLHCEAQQVNLACNTWAINNLEYSSVSLDGVSPPQVWISSSGKMNKAKDEVDILIYEWMISDFSGNAFSHPLDSRKLILIDGTVPYSLFYHQLGGLNPLHQLAVVLSSAALFTQRERAISFHLNPNDTSLSLCCHVPLCQLRCHTSWKESVLIQAVSCFSP